MRKGEEGFGCCIAGLETLRHDEVVGYGGSENWVLDDGHTELGNHPHEHDLLVLDALTGSIRHGGARLLPSPPSLDSTQWT